MDIIGTINEIINENSDISILVVSVIVVGIVQVVKGMGLPNKYAPIVAIVTGITLSMVYFIGIDLRRAFLVGIVLGLNAVGLWSGINNIANGNYKTATQKNLNFYFMKNKK